MGLCLHSDIPYQSLIFMRIISLTNSWLAHSLELEVDADAHIYCGDEGALWWTVWQDWCRIVVLKMSLVSNLPGFQLRLMRPWVDTQACLLHHHFVLKSATRPGWLNVKNSLRSRNISTALMRDMPRLLMLAGKSETLMRVKMAPPQSEKP